jgi:ACS family hexuronate transporter-like MFS transporter
MNRHNVWVASIVMMVCSWLSYVDRQILSVLSPTILAETGMNLETYSTVISFFSIAYMISNFVWGSALDFFGLRRGMLAAVGLWTIASASHAMMGSFGGFAAARALLGFGEGATFPGGFRASLDSLPRSKQARGIALSYSGGSLGAILTPFIVVPIAQAFGWRSAFLVTGALGVAWLALWWFTARPPYLPPAQRKPQRFAIPNPFERRFWALVSAYAVGAFALGLILNLGPAYLNRALGVSQGDLAKLLWIPPLGWEVGYFFWGWISDRFTEQMDRPLPFYVILTVLGFPLAAVTLTTSPIIAAIIFFWAMFVTAGFIVIGLRSGARMYPVEKSALVAGMAAGSWSALVALLLPTFGAWFDQHLYQQAFVVASLMPIVGTTAWWLLSLGSRGSMQSLYHND